MSIELCCFVAIAIVLFLDFKKGVLLYAPLNRVITRPAHEHLPPGGGHGQYRGLCQGQQCGNRRSHCRHAGHQRLSLPGCGRPAVSGAVHGADAGPGRGGSARGTRAVARRRPGGAPAAGLGDVAMSIFSIISALNSPFIPVKYQKSTLSS